MPGWNEKLASDSEASVRFRWAFLCLYACRFVPARSLNTLIPVPERS
jgi:hypothetical protein